VEDPVEIFQAAVDALNAVDRSRVTELADPQIVFVPMRSAVTGAFLGHAGLMDFFDDNEVRYGSFRAEFSELRPLPDGRLLSLGCIVMTGKDDPTETRYPTAGIASFRDGRLASWRDYGSEEAALLAART
jgi:hypothetical protein